MRVAIERFGRVDVVIANQFVQVRTVGSECLLILPAMAALNTLWPQSLRIWTRQSGGIRKR